MNVPQHIAIILDGNGRWAKAKGKPRNYGHAQGSKNVEKICEEAWRMGIKYLTVYAFSTENWKRTTEEVNGFDVPVPVIDEEFDLALIGKKGVWYDHKVSVSNPVAVEETESK